MTVYLMDDTMVLQLDIRSAILLVHVTGETMALIKAYYLDVYLV